MNWSFIPPRAPHFGGLWESGIKCVKHHLRRVVAQATLHFEELSTVLTQIEAMLNSRPLISLSNDPNDLQALTPSHFLTGSTLNGLPDPPDNHCMPLTRRWSLVQSISNDFWKRWSTEYLPMLQRRDKWTKDESCLNINDLVLLAEDNTLPLQWVLGRVTNLIPGSDGIVRVVDVKTSRGVLRRPVVKLRVLMNSEVDTDASRWGACSDKSENSSIKKE